jgi:hypothetical protein
MRYGKPIKNKKRRDPRYFLHEDIEDPDSDADDAAELRDLAHDIEDPGPEGVVAGEESTGGTLHVKKMTYGGISIEDENGQDYGVGEMVKSLLNAGIKDFTSDTGLKAMIKSDKEGIQGGIERWDSDVFPDYYGVDLDRLVQLYAEHKGMQVKNVERTEDDW